MPGEGEVGARGSRGRAANSLVPVDFTQASRSPVPHRALLIISTGHAASFSARVRGEKCPKEAPLHGRGTTGTPVDACTPLRQQKTSLQVQDEKVFLTHFTLPVFSFCL